MHSTTININSEIFNEIEKISSLLNVSKSDVIKKVLWYCKKKSNFKKFFMSLTKYQVPDPKSDWQKFHINYSDLECTVFFYLRFQFRISLSKLLAVGLTLFHKEMIKDEKKADSYTYPSHIYNRLTLVDLEIFNLDKEIQLE